MSDSKTEDGRVFRTGPDGKTEVDEREVVQEESGRDILREMSFSTHVISLNAMALMHLGAVDGVPEFERDAAAAGHIIDTLEMLQAKTKGNLTTEEEHLLGSLLYDLRVNFLRISE